MFLEMRNLEKPRRQRAPGRAYSYLALEFWRLNFIIARRLRSPAQLVLCGSKTEYPHPRTAAHAHAPGLGKKFYTDRM